MGLLETLFQRQKVRPTAHAGVTGAQLVGGYVVDGEKTPQLVDAERFKTFSDVLVNTSIVAASVRYFLNLAGKATWTFQPSEFDKDGRYAELAEAMLTDDPRTNWSRIVKRACMYRFYGFSIQEWTARRRDDGLITFADISPRAQSTIARWDVDDAGYVQGVEQLNPNNSEPLYLPRQKLIYLVDDTLNAAPTGLGLFRHLVEPAARLKRLQDLEMIGFENDLRGIPVGKAPYGEILEKVKSGELDVEDAKKLTAPIEMFLKRHVKNPALGLALDSSVYTTTDEKNAPSSAAKFGMELLQGGPTSLEYTANAIIRINKELARILGTEGIILGDGQAGSQALSKDKSQQLSLTVDSALEEIAYGFRDDLLWTAWKLNGLPEEMMPKLKAAASSYKDAEQITAALRDLATAGASLMPGDPVINEVRAMLGLSPQDPLLTELQLLLTGSDQLTNEDGKTDDTEDPEGKSDDPEEDLPEDETRTKDQKK